MANSLQLPSGWEIKSLRDLTDLITKGTSPSTYGYTFKDEGVNFLKVENLTKNNRISNNMDKIDLECHEKLSRSKFEENDIAFSIAGSLGRMAIITKDLLPLNTNQAVALVRLRDKSTVNYIYWGLQSPNISKEIINISTIGAQPNLSLKQIGNFQLPIPPLKEQQKIAEILSSVDEQIELTEQLIAETKELKQGLMQQLLTKGIGHTEFKKSMIGMIPEDWIIDKLGNYTKIRGGLAPGKIDTFNMDGEIPYFKVDDMNYCKKYLITSKNKVGRTKITDLIKSDSVIFPKRGASISTNKIAILKQDCMMDTNLMALEVVSEKLNNEFLYYYLLNFRLSKIADTSSIPQINNKHIEPLKLLLPPFKEQQKIANILSSVDDQIEIYEQEKAEFEQLKRGLMQKLLTGEIRVKVEEASV